MATIIERLRNEVFKGDWLLVQNQGGVIYYAVALEGLLFHIMTWDDNSNYARVTLCKVQEPSRERADSILQRILKMFEESKMTIHKYYHKDRPYSMNLLESIDLVGGAKTNFQITRIS